ncbi:hypothetical protein AAMO2058_001649900 [Amorphochlora amoebiformis]
MEKKTEEGEDEMERPLWERILLQELSRESKYFTKMQKQQLRVMVDLDKFFWTSNKWSKLILEAKHRTEVARISKVALLSKLEPYWTSTFKHFPETMCRDQSKKERNMLGLANGMFHFVEISIRPFTQALWSVPDMASASYGTFYDLGSGSGRVAIAAALVGNFKKVVGIEILSNLHQISEKAKEKYLENMSDKEVKRLSLKPRVQEIEFIHGSFTKVKWDDADVVFINAGSFGYNVMEFLSSKAESLPGGSYVITTTLPLKSSKFDLISSRQYLTSNGCTTFHIHRRQGERAIPWSRSESMNKFNVKRSPRTSLRSLQAKVASKSLRLSRSQRQGVKRGNRSIPTATKESEPS